jgi:hypothetical protein
LVGEKIKAKFGEFSDQFLGTMKMEDAWCLETGEKVTVLEEKITSLNASNTILAVMATSLQTHIGELEDVIMEDSDAEGDVVELLE